MAGGSVNFRDRLHRGDLLAGTFVKTPHPHVVEVLALTTLDLLAIDAEHAPFDRVALDLAILAARAGGKPVVVRPAAARAEYLMQVLDCGADGIIVPHVRSAEEAARVVRLCHYGPSGRGYAGSTRAAAYTTLGMARTREIGQGITVIAQIEDVEALPEVEGIAATLGVDALFVGRADLTVSLGCDSADDPAVDAATARCVAAAKAANIPCGMFLARTTDVPKWRDAGATLFILQSDQEFLLGGAKELAAAIRS